MDKTAVDPKAVARSSAMTPITWQHPYGSVFFETVAIIFNVSRNNLEYERTRCPPVQPLSQHSSVVTVVLEREQ